MQHFPVPTLGIDVFIPHGEQATAFENQLGQIPLRPPANRHRESRAEVLEHSAESDEGAAARDLEEG